MIRLIEEGSYRLLETIKHTRILSLNEKSQYAWIQAGKIGQILVATQTPSKTDHVLVTGKYRMYDVKDEPGLTDLVRLELLENNIWQGYLLPTGLPTDKKKRSRIIPTLELITKPYMGSLS